jgi:hypothetical protein
LSDVANFAYIVYLLAEGKVSKMWQTLLPTVNGKNVLPVMTSLPAVALSLVSPAKDQVVRLETLSYNLKKYELLRPT